MKRLAIALGLIITTIGLVGIAAPSALLEFGRSMLTPTIIYVAAAVRIALGLVLLWVAPVSCMPKTLRVLGVLIVVAGATTPFIGVAGSVIVLDWLTARGVLFVQAWAGIAVVLGLVIVYAIIPRKSAT